MELRIGGRSGLPSRQIPVVSNAISSASLPGGEPAILGACSGQSAVGSAGCHLTGAPYSQRARSGAPWLSLGVWHCPQTATLSTLYLPRLIRFLSMAFLLRPRSGSASCAQPNLQPLHASSKAVARTACEPLLRNRRR